MFRHTLFLAPAFFLTACNPAPSPQYKIATESQIEARRVATLAAIAKEWADQHEQITSRIADAVKAGQFEEAKKHLNRYQNVAAGALDALARETELQLAAAAKRKEIQATLAALKAAPKDNLAVRRSLISHMYDLEPSAKWRDELAAVNSAINAQAKRAADADRAARRKLGVHIGMSQQDVLWSQWGKPKKINTTTTKYGTREQWVYDGGYLYFEDGKLVTIQN